MNDPVKRLPKDKEKIDEFMQNIVYYFKGRRISREAMVYFKEQTESYIHQGMLPSVISQESNKKD